MDGQNENGGKFKLNHLKVFGSTEGFFPNTKNHRRVFDVSESAYIYAEVSLLNRLAGVEDWNCKVRYYCADLATGAEICNLTKELTVPKTKNNFITDQGWGTPDPGWWKKGSYRWDVYVNEEFIGSSYFYIVDVGAVTKDSNPYFTIQHIRFYESAVNAIPIAERKYLDCFNFHTARYVNAEIKIQITTDVRPLPLDFQFNYYNAKHQLKATSWHFKDITDSGDFYTFDVGYGSPGGKYWKEGPHTLQMEFMNELIASANFEVGQADIPMKTELDFKPEYLGDEVSVRASSDSDHHYQPSAAKSKFHLDYVKVFGSTENFFNNTKAHRLVYDVTESAYLYGELSFYNKLAGEQDWSCKVRFVCTDVGSGAELCDLDHTLNVKKERGLIKTDQGWGTADPGWWKPGKYKWDAYIDSVFVGSAYFYVVKTGLITKESNPYVRVNNMRLFESDIDGVRIDERKYLKAFEYGKARYINAEVNLEILTAERPIPLDMKLVYYNDKGKHKCTSYYFKDITDKKTNLIWDTGYGAKNGKYWRKGNYRVDLVLMDEVIATMPFSVGNQEEETTARLFKIPQNTIYEKSKDVEKREDDGPGPGPGAGPIIEDLT